MKKRLVLFDLDGTLIDSAPGLAASANVLRDRRGLAPLPYEALRESCGKGARGLIYAALRIEPGNETFEFERKTFLDDYATRMVEGCRVFEGIPEMFSAFKESGIVWGVVTNKDERFARPLCEAKGMIPYKNCIVSGCTIGKMKPAPDAIWLAVKQCGFSLEKTVYVGDDYRDALAARAAGIPFFAASWGYTGSSTPVETWGAQGIAATPRELPALIRTLD